MCHKYWRKDPKCAVNRVTKERQSPGQSGIWGWPIGIICWMEGHAETEKARSHKVGATVFYGVAARSVAVEWDVQRRLRVSDMRHGGIAKPT